MRKHSFLTSTALVSGLFAVSLPAPAYAAVAGILSPVTQWAVTKVDSTDAQDGYCALARRFTANTILTLARNPDNEISIALDFQAPKLPEGQNMKIVLDPGAGEQRSYYITPVSQEAFVVRLGRDDKFSNAMQTTGFLRIQAGGESYGFNLADIDQGQAQIQNCLNTLDAPVTMKKADAGDSGSGMKGEIEKLRADIQALRKDNERLTSVISKADNVNDDQKPAVVAEALSSHAGELERQNRHLRNAVSTSGISAGQPYGEDNALGGLESQNSKLRKQLRDMVFHTGGDDRDGLLKRVALLEQENEGLRSQIGPADDGASEESQKQIYSLKEENQRLQSMLDVRSQAMQVADNLQTENTQLKSDLQAAETKAGSVDDLQKRLDNLAQSLQEKEQKLVELSNAATEAEQLRKRNAELEQQLKEKSGDSPDVAQLNDRIKDLELENDRLIQQLQTATADSNAKIAALTKENEDLKAQIADLKQGKGVEQAAQGELEKLRAENADLKKQLEAAKNGAGGNEELAALRKENAELKEKLKGMDGMAAEKATTEKQLADEKKHSEGLEADLKAAQEKAMQANAGPMCEKDVSKEIAKVKRQADIEKQKEMQSLARENMSLKERLAAYAPSSESPSAAEPAAIDNNVPVSVSAEPVKDASEDMDSGMSDAQREEARMRQSMQKKDALAPKAAPPASKEEIKWNAPPAAAKPVSGPPPASVSATMNGFSVQDALAKAGIVSPGQVQKVDKASGTGRYAWQWQSGAVYGSAEQKPLASDAQFENEIKQYLEKTQSRCAGDFAVSPDESVQAGSARIDSYEIACIGKTVNSSASLLFVDKGGTFTVIAHEAPTDKMTEAMNLRDRLMKTVGAP